MEVSQRSVEGSKKVLMKDNSHKRMRQDGHVKSDGKHSTHQSPEGSHHSQGVGFGHQQLRRHNSQHHVEHNDFNSPRTSVRPHGKHDVQQNLPGRQQIRRHDSQNHLKHDGKDHHSAHTSIRPHGDGHGHPSPHDNVRDHGKPEAHHRSPGAENDSPLLLKHGIRNHPEPHSPKVFKSRAEQTMTNAHAKFLKGTKKAIAAFELTRGLDSKDFRQRVIEFLKLDAEDRMEEDTEGFLHMVEKFAFFAKHTPEQQQELAMVAKHKIFSMEHTLFRQEEPPDGLYVVLTGRCGIFKTQGDMRKLVAVAGWGDSIGDVVQLDEKCRRSVTVQISSEKAEFMYFSKADLDQLAVEWRVLEEAEKTRFIVSAVPVLNNVPFSILENLSPYFEKLTVAKDTVVYRQQDESNGIFFVWEGRLQIVKRIDLIKPTGPQARAGTRPGPHSKSSSKLSPGTSPTAVLAPGRDDWHFAPKKQSRSVQVSVVGPGEYFGEVEVFNDLPRASAVIAMSDCKLLSLSRHSLTEVMPQSLLSAIFRYSSMRVQWRNSRLLLILENLARINWMPERDPKLSLEPELKPLPKMRSVLLPMLAPPPEERRPWLGAHTIQIEEDAREWGLYHHGGWAKMPDKQDRIKEERNAPAPGGGGGKEMGLRRQAVGKVKGEGEGGEDGERMGSPLAGVSGAQSTMIMTLKARKEEMLGASYFASVDIKLAGATAASGVAPVRSEASSAVGGVSASGQS